MKQDLQIGFSGLKNLEILFQLMLSVCFMKRPFQFFAPETEKEKKAEKNTEWNLKDQKDKAADHAEIKKRLEITEKGNETGRE